MLGPYFLRNGELLPIEKAVIFLDNIEYSYGYGVYENLKVRNRILYFPKMHIDRLFFSAGRIGIPLSIEKSSIQEQITELIKKIRENSFNIKILLLGNDGSSDMYVMALAPAFIPKKAYSQGVFAITFSGERLFPQAKTLNMLMSYLAYKKAKEHGSYDALLVDAKNQIVEGTRTNLFFTDGKTIFTSPKKLVLNGVTRITVIAALKKSGILVKEKILKKDEIKKYNGFFLTSASSKILPLSKIDDMIIQIPASIREAMQVYEVYLQEYAKSAEKIPYPG